MELQLRRAARAPGWSTRLLERRSGDAGRARAAAALLRGGEDPARAGRRGARRCRRTSCTCTTCSRSLGPRGARGRARRRRARGAPPPQPPPVLRDRRGLARRRPVLSLPRPAHAPRRWCSTAAARCPSPRPTRPASRCTSRHGRGAWTLRGRRAAGPREQLARHGLPARAAGGAAATTCPTEAFADAIARGRGRLRARGRAALRGEGHRRGDPRRRARRRAAAGGGRRAASGPRWPRLADELRRPGRVPRTRRPRRASPSCSPARRRCCALALSTSSRRYAAMEAMAAGVPVLAARLGGLPETGGPGALRAAGRRRRAGRAACASSGRARRSATRRARR